MMERKAESAKSDVAKVLIDGMKELNEEIRYVLKLLNAVYSRQRNLIQYFDKEPSKGNDLQMGGDSPIERGETTGEIPEGSPSPREKKYRCEDCGRKIRHRGRCLACNVKRKKERELEASV